MICAKGHYMPDKNLACPTCASERAAEGFRHLQLEYLRKVANAEFSYSLRVAKKSERHVMMFGSHTRTFCGRELEERPRIEYEPYNDVTLSRVCAGCRIELTSLMQEVMP